MSETRQDLMHRIYEQLVTIEIENADNAKLKSVLSEVRSACQSVVRESQTLDREKDAFALSVRKFRDYLNQQYAEAQPIERMCRNEHNL